MTYRVTSRYFAVRSIDQTDLITSLMYNVIYIDAHGLETPIASNLADRQAAADLARQEAAKLGVGRMMLPGSSKQCNCICVVPVHTAAA